MRDTALGALLGVFVGDALGMPYEGQPGHAIPDRVEMRDGRRPPGSYTDDTQMTIALAESLLRRGTVNQEDLAATFRAHFNPTRGYGSGTTTVMVRWDEGVPVSVAAGRLFDGDGSRRNGAAMRVAPVALRFSSEPDRVISQARLSARVTHTHPEGIDGAVVQAVAVAAALRDEDPFAAALTSASTDRMLRRLKELSRTAQRGLEPRAFAGRNWRIGVDAAESVPVAVVIGSSAQSFEDAVSLAVRCGGDTDTVAAMAGAIAGARFGAQSIPARWYAVLEDGADGRTHVERLALALMDAAPKGLTSSRVEAASSAP